MHFSFLPSKWNDSYSDMTLQLKSKRRIKMESNFPQYFSFYSVLNKPRNIICHSLLIRKTERQKDRKTERQKDRKTERLKT